MLVALVNVPKAVWKAYFRLIATNATDVSPP